MTEGIIQKTFKNMLQHPYSGYTMNEKLWTFNDIAKLEQELIEAIKQYDCYYCNRNKYVKDEVWHKHVIQIQDLIGDNQE